MAELFCKVCGIKKRAPHRRLCWKCQPGGHNLGNSRTRKLSRLIGEKTICAMCAFVPAHPCQMDFDHKDGNPNNNERNNVQVLCANCHRLKTQTNGETRWRGREKSEFGETTTKIQERLNRYGTTNGTAGVDRHQEGPSGCERGC